MKNIYISQLTKKMDSRDSLFCGRRKPNEWNNDKSLLGYDDLWCQNLQFFGVGEVYFRLAAREIESKNGERRFVITIDYRLFRDCLLYFLLRFEVDTHICFHTKTLGGSHRFWTRTSRKCIPYCWHNYS